MRSNRERATRWANTVNLLVVLVADAIVPQIAGAFQLWPNKLTKVLGSDRQDPAHPLASGQYRSVATATTTTSTTSTTTQTPPIELHFEINPDELEQRPPGHHEADEWMGQQAVNGTLILEDLVNQFERNFNLKHALKDTKRNEPAKPSIDRDSSPEPVGSQEFNRLSNQNLLQTISPGEPTNRSAQYTMSAPPDHADIIAKVSVDPVGELASHQEGNATTIRSGQVESDALVDTPYPPELDPDRHIQYDTPVGEHETSEPTKKATSGQQVNYTLEWDGAVSPDQPNGARSVPTGVEPPRQNSTLAPPPKSTTRDDLQQSPPPLLIVSATQNVSVDAATSPSNSLPAVLKSNSSIPPESDDSRSTPPTRTMVRSASSSQAQARSMSGVSSRLPQHSKAPYASYNMFNQRSDANRKPPTQTSTPASNPNNGAKPSLPSANQEASNSSNTSSGPNSHPAPSTSATQSSETEASSPPSGSELAGSIEKISSHLVDEGPRVDAGGSAASPLAAAGPTSATTTSTTTTTSGNNNSNNNNTTPRPKPMTLVDQLQSYLNGIANQNADRRQEQRDELERVVSKLAPHNELIELDPLPSQTLISERQFSNSNQKPPGRDSHLSSRNDRYSPSQLELASVGVGPLNSFDIYQANEGGRASSRPVPVRSNSEQAHDLGVVVSSLTGETSLHNGDASETHESPSPVLHRKTIEMLSNQIKQSDSGLLAGPLNTSTVHQHRERSPTQQQLMMAPLNRDAIGPGATFAASLINVTAPILLPLSASEAMEASVASLNKQHEQATGSPVSPNHRSGLSHQQHQQQQSSPNLSSHHAIPVPPVMPHDSIYSKPVNQFRSTAHTARNPGDRDAFGAGLMASAAERERMRTGDNHYGFFSSSSGSSKLSPSHLASGFRSPLNQHPTTTQTNAMSAGWPPFGGFGQAANRPTPASYLTGLESATASSLSQASSPSTISSTNMSKFASSTPATPISGTNNGNNNGRPQAANSNGKQQLNAIATTGQPIANGFITGSVVNTTLQPTQIDLIATVTSGGGTAGGASPHRNQESVSSQVVGGGQQQQGTTAASASKRAFNLTRVEHISAECSNDLIRTIIIFNGTFKGIIYSSGYVGDPNCLYVNGTGKTRYDFSIRLNQCGTLGRQELHSANGPDEVRRRDQVMWNSLSIQYNPIIEQEWDEHFRVSCEYGSDFWKTVSFSPFNVETNTGSPVVFTVDPPQCQMEILKGHGMVGPRQEAISGPVTVGDPLTLLIHMKSEKAGYDILVKNCIAHNGGHQKMQLIDSNGCVVNERFISPFRGTYNDNDLKHVTLYSYLKAFRFTGSPVLYLECEVHMCQTACPPQMCYWRRLSKRSVGRPSNETTTLLSGQAYDARPASEGDDHDATGPLGANTTSARRSRRTGRELKLDKARKTSESWAPPLSPASETLSDKINLFQALEVHQERLPDPKSAASLTPHRSARNDRPSDLYEIGAAGVAGFNQLMCYQRVEIFAFLFTVASILLAAISVTIGCYCHASSLKRRSMTTTRSRLCEYDTARMRLPAQKYPRAHPLASSMSLNNCANLCYSPMSSSSNSSSASSPLPSPSSSCRPGGSKNFARPLTYSDLAPSISSGAR